MSEPLAPDVVAGVSLHAPRSTYTLDDLPFGGAVLERTLEGDVVDVATLTVRTSRTATSVVRFTLRPAGVGLHDREPPDMTPMRALILEHGLFAHPELLTGDAALSGTPDEAALLGALRARLPAALRRTRSHRDRDVCDVCARLRREDREGRVAEQIAEVQAALATAQGFATRTTLEYRLRSLRAGITDSALDVDGDCEHAPHLHAALRAAVAAWPELAFEMAGLLVPARALRPARFVLPTALLRDVLEAWLVGQRSRTDDVRSLMLGSWRRRPPSRVLSQARRTVHLGDEVPPAMQDVIAWVARAQGSDFERIARTWRSAGSGDDAAPDDDVRISSEVLLPDGMKAPPSATDAAPPPAEPVRPGLRARATPKRPRRR